jgi:hypothetical protein
MAADPDAPIRHTLARETAIHRKVKALANKRTFISSPAPFSPLTHENGFMRKRNCLPAFACFSVKK